MSSIEKGSCRSGWSTYESERGSLNCSYLKTWRTKSRRGFICLLTAFVAVLIAKRVGDADQADRLWSSYSLAWSTHSSGTEFDELQPNVTSPNSSLVDVSTKLNQDVDIDHQGEGEEDEGEEEEVDEDWELDMFQITWGTESAYKIMEKLGEGVYSDVYKCFDAERNRSCVSKELRPVSKRRVKREIKILQDISDGPNVVKLFDVIKNDETNAPSIVTEYINGSYYRTLFASLSDTEIRFYMFQLLRAIEHAHSKNIMHRDIKPHNVMIDHADQKLRLIDWGLSDYYDENFSYTTSVASRFWRPPELLVNYRWYNLSVDMWAFGCMLAALIFQKEPFFHGRYNDVNQLVEISKVLGTDGLFQWVEEHSITLGEEFDGLLTHYERTGWEPLVSASNSRSHDSLALDLINKTLIYDHQNRVTAKEALGHPYFDEVREQAMLHLRSFTT